MENISSNLFKEILRRPPDYKNVTPYIKIERNSQDEIYTIVFDNMSINDELSLTNDWNFGYNLKFINGCVLKSIISGRFDHITFENSRIETIYLSGDSKIKSISIDKNSELNSLMLQNETKIEFVEITGFGRINTITIDSKSNIGKLELPECGTLDHCMVNNASIDEILCRYQSNINSITCFRNCKIDKIINSHWGFIGEFYLNNSSIDQFSSNENSFIGSLELKDNSSVSNLDFNIGSHIGDMEIEGNLGKVKIEGTLSRLFIGNVNLTDSIKIFDSQIETMSIEKNNSGKISLYIENSSISSLNITNSLFTSSDLINVSNSKLHSFNVRNLHNYGNITFSGVKELLSWDIYFRDENKNVILNLNETNYVSFKINKYFQSFSRFSSGVSILDSNLGNTMWINCDFEPFDELRFSNSKLLDCFIASTKFPGENKFYIYDKKSKTKAELENQKRLFYGQLKNIYVNQGDSPRAASALSIELEAYRNQLKYERKQANWYFFKSLNKKEYINNIKDRFVLFINRKTSNYGTNWLRSTVTTLLFLFIAFSFYCFLLGYRPGTDFIKFYELFSFSFQYLNPFRDEDSGDFFKVLNSDSIYIIPSTARIWDYFSRVVISFMIYQTIVAFRRLGKINS